MSDPGNLQRLTSERRMLEVLQAHPGWMGRGDMAHVLRRGGLNASQINALNRMAAHGVIEMREAPTPKNVMRYEYRAVLPPADGVQP